MVLQMPTLLLASGLSAAHDMWKLDKPVKECSRMLLNVSLKLGAGGSEEKRPCTLRWEYREMIVEVSLAGKSVWNNLLCGTAHGRRVTQGGDSPLHPSSDRNTGDSISDLPYSPQTLMYFPSD